MKRSAQNRLSRRRLLLAATLGWPSLWLHAEANPDASTATCRPQPGSAPLPRPLARFAAGVPGVVDLAPLLPAGLSSPKHAQGSAASRKLQLKLAREPGPNEPPGCGALLPADAQFPEFRLADSLLYFDGSAAGALQAGASAVRVRLVADAAQGSAHSLWVSDTATILVDSPLSVIRHGLDQWPSFAALNRAVQGNAPPGTLPQGRTDLIGQTFRLTPGMLTELADGHGAAASPVAAVQFPCTVRALDPRHRPVLRSVTGERDVLQVAASLLPPIDGEVVIEDLVIRDNRHWRDTGEAGLRLKDQFPGRSVRVERCEFVRCQNAVAGGTRGQTLRIIDCRIVDCGLGARAHGLYVGPQWLEFTGNHVLQSPGNRLARAHLLKSRALVARILGNRFDLNDSPGSYLIDLSNGGDAEIGGNLLRYGRLSDNEAATLIAYAAEGPLEQPGPDQPVFSNDRRFRLVVRNNTVESAFAGASRVMVVYAHNGHWPDGRAASTWPEPMQFDDNLISATGALALVTRRERLAWALRETELPGPRARNTVLSANRRLVANLAGNYTSRRFSGHTALGTGSQAHVFTHAGAG